MNTHLQVRRINRIFMLLSLVWDGHISGEKQESDGTSGGTRLSAFGDRGLSLDWVR